MPDLAHTLRSCAILQDFQAIESRNAPHHHRPPNHLPRHYEIWFQKRPFLIMMSKSSYRLKQRFSTRSVRSLVLDDNNVKISQPLLTRRSQRSRVNVTCRLAGCSHPRLWRQRHRCGRCSNARRMCGESASAHSRRRRTNAYLFSRRCADYQHQRSAQPLPDVRDEESLGRARTGAKKFLCRF